MRVLGIDPGTIAMGYGIIDGEELKVVDYGALLAPRGVPIARRLQTLYEDLRDVIARYQPSEVAIEEPNVARNRRATMAVGQAQAVAILAATERGIPVFNYTPTRIKQLVSGYGASGKEQVQEMVRIQLGLDQAPQPNDASDALAVAICHIVERRISRLLTLNKGEPEKES